MAGKRGQFTPEFKLEAVRMANGSERPLSQVARELGIRADMLRTWKRQAESFFATLEWELIEQSDWHTHAEARRAIFDYIEVWYNRQRRHSSLGSKSPAEYEEDLALMRRAA